MCALPSLGLQMRNEQADRKTAPPVEGRVEGRRRTAPHHREERVDPHEYIQKTGVNVEVAAPRRRRPELASASVLAELDEALRQADAMMRDEREGWRRTGEEKGCAIPLVGAMAEEPRSPGTRCGEDMSHQCRQEGRNDVDGAPVFHPESVHGSYLDEQDDGLTQAEVDAMMRDEGEQRAQRSDGEFCSLPSASGSVLSGCSCLRTLVLVKYRCWFFITIFSRSLTGHG